MPEDVEWRTDVEPNEPVARYLFHGSQIRPSNNTVKPSAFLPPADTLKTSVFRTKGLSDQEAWTLGARHVVGQNERTIRGLAEVTVGAITRVGLGLEPDNRPPRHANIVGWSPEKSDRQLCALELAAAAVLRLP